MGKVVFEQTNLSEAQCQIEKQHFKVKYWNCFFYNNLAQVAECLFFLQKSLHPTVVVFIDSSDGLANHCSS